MQKNMEKIIGINPVLEILRSDKNIEKIEVYKGIKKDTIKEILNLASKRNIRLWCQNLIIIWIYLISWEKYWQRTSR